jgi:exodeoxyribonuclease V alpha subunit
VITGDLILCAPTGKAARRLAETTKREADTIHRILQADAEGNFKYNAANRLPDGCFVLVDEASMLDTKLTCALLEALPDNGRILFVGDKDQLPSVDIGYVLGDMLTATAANDNVVPSSELTQVFRSAGDTMIATYAKEIKEGTFEPEILQKAMGPAGVSFFRMTRDKIALQVDHTFRVLSAQLKLDPMKDIAILCPQRAGQGGTHQINALIQANHNPTGAPIKEFHRIPGMDPEEPIPRVNDRIIIKRNDNELKIRNGDVGVITEYLPESGKVGAKLKIQLESGKFVTIPAKQSPHLITLAYAITGHKSQGSQYACVIMPMSLDHERMLGRTLTYTEWTRAKRFVIIVGEEQAFRHSIENVSASDRKTLLKTHIERELGRLPQLTRRQAPIASGAPSKPAANPVAAPPRFLPQAGPSAPAPKPASTATSNGTPPAFLRRPSFSNPFAAAPAATPKPAKPAFLSSFANISVAPEEEEDMPMSAGGYGP